MFVFLVFQVFSRFGSWLVPLHELPKTPEMVEEKLEDIAEHKDHLFKTAEECSGVYVCVYVRTVDSL